MTEDGMVGGHNQLNGYEFDQTLGDSEEQEIMAVCHPWDHKASDMTQVFNNNNVLQIDRQIDRYRYMKQTQFPPLHVITERICQLFVHSTDASYVAIDQVLKID